LKSREDLDNRIAMVDDLTAKSKQVEAACAANDPDPANLRTLDLEQQLLVNSPAIDVLQGSLWQVANKPFRSNPLCSYPSELAQFNSVAAEIRSLGAQQMQLMKKKH